MRKWPSIHPAHFKRQRHIFCLNKEWKSKGHNYVLCSWQRCSFVFFEVELDGAFQATAHRCHRFPEKKKSFLLSVPDVKPSVWGSFTHFFSAFAWISGCFYIYNTFIRLQFPVYWSFYLLFEVKAWDILKVLHLHICKCNMLVQLFKKRMTSPLPHSLYPPPPPPHLILHCCSHPVDIYLNLQKLSFNCSKNTLPFSEIWIYNWLFEIAKIVCKWNERNLL